MLSSNRFISFYFLPHCPPPHMTKGSRRIAVDDADVSRIQYSGNWVTETGNHDGLSSKNGPTYKHTQHGTIVDGASLSFLFNGTCLCREYSSSADLSQALPFNSLARGIRTTTRPYPPGRASLMELKFRVRSLPFHRSIKMSSVGTTILMARRNTR